MHFRRLALSAAVITIAAFSVDDQKSRPDFNRYSDYDVQHYTIRASFDRAKKEVFGDTTVTFRPTKADFKSIELDAVDLNFTSVKLDPSVASLRYKRTPPNFVATLANSYHPTH